MLTFEIIRPIGGWSAAVSHSLLTGNTNTGLSLFSNFQLLQLQVLLWSTQHTSAMTPGSVSLVSCGNGSQSAHRHMGAIFASLAKGGLPFVSDSIPLWQWTVEVGVERHPKPNLDWSFSAIGDDVLLLAEAGAIRIWSKVMTRLLFFRHIALCFWKSLAYKDQIPKERSWGKNGIL